MENILDCDTTMHPIAISFVDWIPSAPPNNSIKLQQILSKTDFYLACRREWCRCTHLRQLICLAPFRLMSFRFTNERSQNPSSIGNRLERSKHWLVGKTYHRRKPKGRCLIHGWTIFQRQRLVLIVRNPGIEPHQGPTPAPPLLDQIGLVQVGHNLVIASNGAKTTLPILGSFLQHHPGVMSNSRVVSAFPHNQRVPTTKQGIALKLLDTLKSLPLTHSALAVTSI